MTAIGETGNLTVVRGWNGTTAARSTGSAINKRVAGNRFRISVDNTPYVGIDLSGLNVAGISGDVVEERRSNWPG